MDGSVLAFTLGVATLAAVAFAFAPPLPAIASAGSQLGAGVQRVLGGRARQRVQRSLVVAQVAVSIMVLTGAGLLARTLAKLYEVDTGLDIENVLTMNVPLEGAGRTAAERLALYEEMRRRIAALPGVIEVGLGSTVPLTGESFMLEVKADGLTPAPGEPTPRAEYRTSSPEFFRAAGIPLLRGRAFEATDGPDAGRVVILNRTLAERIFGDRDPIGWQVAWTGEVLRFIPVSGDWRTVVGVVMDTRIAIGLVGALVGARLLTGLLFGVPPHDPVTLAGVSLLMTAVGVLACAVPAVRAARVNPVEAIRTE